MPVSSKENQMALTLAPKTETRLRTLTEALGLEPAELYKDFLQRQRDDFEAKMNETLVEQGNLNRPTE